MASATVDTVLTITPDGKVGDAQAKSGNAELSACIQTRARALRFPTAETVTKARVRIRYGR